MLHPFFTSAYAQTGTWSDEQIEQLKKTVVNIEVSVETAFGKEEAGRYIGTGFVVDKKLGIIGTNQHVTGISPISLAKAKFVDGSKVKINMLYYDPWHDVAFFKYNPEEASFSPEEVVFGKFSTVQLNDPVLLIGNPEGANHTVLDGKITNLFSNSASNTMGRYSHQIQSSINGAGGSSGSPVWDQNGLVIGLHNSGNEASSSHLRIDYMTILLDALKKGKIPQRGDTFIVFNTIEVSEAIDQYGFDMSLVDWSKVDALYRKELMMITGIVPGISEDVETNTLLISINDTYIGSNIFLFDQIVNQSIGKTVTLGILKRTIDGLEKQEVEVRVFDAEEYRIKEYLYWENTVFHNMPPHLAIIFQANLDQVFASQTQPTSSLTRNFYNFGDDKNRLYVIIQSIFDAPMSNVRDMYSFITAHPMQYYPFGFRDCQGYRCESKTNIRSTSTIPQMFVWDDNTLTWKAEEY
ncbi:MAG: trypsin-like peptidase domain-containing protein [Deltaproteobacteria bacterium]|nr:trypsin-like peptidase domain-containing protein [Deltaproteobacteria bacterium]